MGLPPLFVKDDLGNKTLAITQEFKNTDIRANGAETEILMRKFGNAISNPTAFKDISGWSSYNDAAAAPVDGTGGTVSGSFVLSRTTTAGEVLLGDTAFKIAKTGTTNLQGHGVAIDITVPEAHKGQQVQIKFPWKGSAAYVTGAYSLFLIQDPAGTPVVITPDTGSLDGSRGVLQFTFAPADSVSTYRLVIHLVSDTTADFDLTFGPVEWVLNEAVYSSVVRRDSITLTGYNGKGATNTVIMRFDSIQDSSLDNGLFTYADSASNGMSITVNRDCFARINFGFQSTNDTNSHMAGISKNSNQLTTAIPSITAAHRLGCGIAGQTVSTRANPKAFWSGKLVAGDVIRAHTSTNTVPNEDASTFFSFSAEEIINQPVTNAKQFRISSYLANGTRVTGSAPTALGQYRSYLRNAGLGTVTETNGSPAIAPTSADGIALYTVGTFAAADANNNPSRYDIFIGRNKVFKLEVYDSAGRAGHVDITPGLVVAAAFGYQTYYDNSTGVFTIEKFIRGGPTTLQPGYSNAGTDATSPIYFDILVSEDVNAVTFIEERAASYTTNAGQTISTGIGSPQIVNFEDTGFDPHIAVTTGASWKYTATEKGKYTVNSKIRFQTFNASANLYLSIFKNGTEYKRGQTICISGSSNLWGVGVSGSVDLLPGDYIDIRVAQDTGVNQSLTTTSVENYVDIQKVSI